MPVAVKLLLGALVVLALRAWRDRSRPGTSRRVSDVNGWPRDEVVDPFE